MVSEEALGGCKVGHKLIWWNCASVPLSGLDVIPHPQINRLVPAFHIRVGLCQRLYDVIWGVASMYTPSGA